MNDERYYHEIVCEEEGPFFNGRAVLPTQENVSRQIDLASRVLDLPFKGLARVVNHRDFIGLACYDPIQKELLFRNRRIHEGYILHEAVHAVMDNNNLLLRVNKVEDNPFFIFGRLFNDTVADLASLEVYGSKSVNYSFDYGDFNTNAKLIRNIQKDFSENEEINPDYFIDKIIDVIGTLPDFDLEDLYNYQGQLAFEGAVDLYRRGQRNKDYRFKDLIGSMENKLNAGISFPIVYFSLFDKHTD